MGEVNWSLIDGGLSAASCRRGVTGAFTPPPGGGSFVFGFSSEVTTTGFAGLYVNTANFSPLRNDAAGPTGGSVRFAMKKGVSAASTGWSPLVFCCLRAGAAGAPAPNVNDVGYLFGFEDNHPARLAFRKGAPVGGLPSSPASALLRASSDSYPVDQWLHARMDVIVNPNGDVVVKFFKNDLAAVGASVATPTWVAIPGMSDFVDDALGISSGSVPLAGGFVGFGQWSAGLQRRSFIDHVSVLRQR